MGEEAKQEKTKVGAKSEEEKPAPPPAEAKKEEEQPKPPSPLVLYVGLHCAGCAKKIERSIMKIRGVERVTIDMAQNQVTIKGIVEPQAVCNIIMKRTKRVAKVLSPLPEAEGEPIPEVVAAQVNGPTTVELNVDMHCEACAEQLKSKILKMRGVQTATTELSTGKVTVTGTMDANKLGDYIYRRTKKQARILPQPEPEPVKEPEGEPQPVAGEVKKEENNAEKKEEEEKPAEEAKKEGGEGDQKPENNEKINEEGMHKEGPSSGEGEVIGYSDEEGMKRMVYYYQPLYVIERFPPAPQLFSDENPNACCIS